MKVKTDRLLALANFLRDEVSKNIFEMTDWVCDSRACAVGWACQIPKFRKLGLSFKFEMLEDDSGINMKVNPFPVYKGFEGEDAVKEFFGIEHEDFYNLFSHCGYKSENPSPKTVAAKIEKFVANATSPKTQKVS
jgi:hypothetical protein